MTTVRITDTSTRADIAGVLAEANYHAKRKPKVIETFAEDPPTAWSEAHSLIDCLLDDWQQADA
jgi:hypothetical protein